MALSMEDYAYLLADIGDENGAFEYDEIAAIYDRLEGAPSEAVRLRAVKAVCFERLLNSASKLHDYTAGAVDEKLSQVVKHLKDRYEDYKTDLVAATASYNQLVISKLGKRAHADRREP